MADGNRRVLKAPAQVSLDDTSVTEWRRTNGNAFRTNIYVSLDDTSVTEWRTFLCPATTTRVKVSLDDTSVTEWRIIQVFVPRPLRQFHSMIPVLLNGGIWIFGKSSRIHFVSLDDTSVTEWRWESYGAVSLGRERFHSMIPVLLNGGTKTYLRFNAGKMFHSMIPVLLNGGSPLVSV